MSLTFIGPSGSFERRWIIYAMLRDNVQHHFEQGTPSSAFSALHRIGDALVAGRTAVPALALRRELLRARELLERPLSDLAVSLRTRAVCAHAFPLPETRATLLASEAEWTAPLSITGMNKLGDLFGSLVEELLRITETTAETDELKVIDC